jgi:hypothetical protein
MIAAHLVYGATLGGCQRISESAVRERLIPQNTGDEGDLRASLSG